MRLHGSWPHARSVMFALAWAIAPAGSVMYALTWILDLAWSVVYALTRKVALAKSLMYAHTWNMAPYMDHGPARNHETWRAQI